jgi:zinc/manganese transport system permease protein
MGLPDVAVLSALFLEPFAEFAFMRRALAGCLALSFGGAPVGVILMLRRMSLTGDAMSHAILPGAAIGYLIAGLSLPAMTIGGVVAGLLVTLIAAYVARSSRQSEDSSLAAFYLLSLSVGVVIVSASGSSVDLLHVLFGSVLALDDAALYLLGSIASASLLVLAVLYRPLVFECVNPGLMPRQGRWSAVAHQGFMMLLVLNLVAGFHALGTLMSVGMMILPAAAARFWVREFNRLLALAVAIAFAGSLAGLLLSYHQEWPTGPTIVLVLGAVYCFSLLAGRQGIITANVRPRRHYQA